MQQGHARLEEKHQMGAIAIDASDQESGQKTVTSLCAAAASESHQAGIAPSPAPGPEASLSHEPSAADLSFNKRPGPGQETRPDKFVLETRLIELGATLSAAQNMFKLLERDFYLAAFGRYDD